MIYSEPILDTTAKFSNSETISKKNVYSWITVKNNKNSMLFIKNLVRFDLEVIVKHAHGLCFSCFGEFIGFFKGKIDLLANYDIEKSVLPTLTICFYPKKFKNV